VSENCNLLLDYIRKTPNIFRVNAKDIQQISSSAAEISQTSRNYPYFTETQIFFAVFKTDRAACPNPEPYESTPRPSIPFP
jgi:hypothetical protein